MNRSVLRYFVLSGLVLCLSSVTAIGLRAQSVDLLTGRLQYGIPLGQLSAGDISIPISISHHGGAIGVAEGEGDCGVGWSLAAGGSITRIVRGRPDEENTSYRKGWLHTSYYSSIQSFTPSGNDVLSNCSDEASDYNFLNNFGYVHDTEPDLFYFNAPGLGGQFILGHDSLPRLLVLQDISISKFNASSFTIKNSQGLTYTFSAIEVVSRDANGTVEAAKFTEFNYGTDVEFTSRWLLTSVESSATGVVANFYYQNLQETIYTAYKEDSLYSIQDRFVPKRLDSITLKNYTVEFNYANRVLNKVEFREKESANKKAFEFYYQTFRDAAYSVNPHPISRTFLRSVREVGAACSPYSSIEFTYAKVDWSKPIAVKPWKTNWKQDWFGYYNGKATNKNKAQVYFYTSEVNGRRVRVTPISGGSPITLSGDDRSVVLDSLLYGALTKIVVPTGGTVDITYESNKYYDASTSEDLDGGGLRVKQISSNGSEIAFGKGTSVNAGYRAIKKRYEYKVSDSPTAVSSGKILAPLKFGYFLTTGEVRSSVNRGDPSEILYTRVKEIVDSLGSTVYVFRVPGAFPDTVDGDWKAAKTKIARVPGGSSASGNYKNGYYTYPFAPSTNYNFKRGFLESVSQYSKSGTLVRKREMTPTQLPSSPPAAIKAVKFEKQGISFYYSVYEILTERAQVVGKEVTTEYSESSPSDAIRTATVYSYNSNNILQQITDTLADLSVRTQKFKYAKDYLYTSPSDTAAVALKALNNANRHSELVEQITKLTPNGGTEILTGAQLVIYRDFGSNRVLPYYIKSVRPGATVTESSVGGSQSFSFDSDYYTVRTFKKYDSEGRVLSEFDDQKNRVAHHYSTTLGYEAATIANAKSGQSVYEGFETATTSGLAITSGTASYGAGWTGERAIQMSSSVVLTSSTLEKAESRYRLSCWVKSAQATNLSFKAKEGATVKRTVTIATGSSDQWTYFEREMEMDQTPAVPSSFTLEIVSSHTILVDDILFIPISARVALQTIEPFVGATSATDDSGNSVKYEYDERGRKIGTLDRNRNLVEKNDYGNQKQIAPEILAGFTSTVTYYRTSEEITFISLPNCGSVTYQWAIDGVNHSTGSSMTNTFYIPGSHLISLTVSNGTGSKTFDEDICFDLGGSELGITVTYPNSSPFLSGAIANCNTPNLTFSLTGLPGGCTNTVTWQWVVYEPHYGSYIRTVTGTLGTGSSFNLKLGNGGYLEAVVQIVCGGTGNLKCLGERDIGIIIPFNIGWETVPCE